MLLLDLFSTLDSFFHIDDVLILDFLTHHRPELCRVRLSPLLVVQRVPRRVLVELRLPEVDVQHEDLREDLVQDHKVFEGDILHVIQIQHRISTRDNLLVRLEHFLSKLVHLLARQLPRRVVSAPVSPAILHRQLALVPCIRGSKETAVEHGRVLKVVVTVVDIKCV